MAVIEIAKIQVRRGQENQTGIPQLAGGEFAWAADNETLYIGLKREDGGARDANVRVLTENDINLFRRLASEGMLNTATNYIWSWHNSEEITSSTYITSLTGQDVAIRYVQNKLDEFVSIADFITTASSADCSIGVQAAIDHLFLDWHVESSPPAVATTTTNFNTPGLYDPGNTKKFNKKLYFPAGIYNIGTTLKIPRNTVIVGEGIDKTIIRDATVGTGIFKTVDFVGRRNYWSADDEYQGELDVTSSTSATLSITGPGRPKNIHIEGMTLEYTNASSTNPNLALLNLDGVENAVIREVKFLGTITSTVFESGTTFGGPGYTGIDIRGYGVNAPENILIDNCQFTGLYYDIKSNYESKHIVIQNNSFSYSKYGVAFNTATNALTLANAGPMYARIVNNKFQDIYEQGIYVGAANSLSIPTNHISQNNSFVNVGDRGDPEGTTGGTSVIKFATSGNASVNDYFGRYQYHNTKLGTIPDSTSTYYPLIDGRATIDLNSVSTATLAPAPGVDTLWSITPIMRLPITDNEQHLIIKYQCTYNTWGSGGIHVNKAGTLHVYIRPTDPATGDPADIQLVDEHNMYGTDPGIFWGIDTSVNTYSYFDLVGCSLATHSVQVELQTKLML
jgi:hypothetical protein